MKKTLIFLIGIAVFGYSCEQKADSDTVKQEKIYQQYSIYIEEGGSAYATAEFYIDGSDVNLELKGNAKVVLNGEKMIGRDEIVIGGYEYNKSVKTNTKDFKFEFTDNDDKKYTNSISVIPPEITNNIPYSATAGSEIDVEVSNDEGTTDLHFKIYGQDTIYDIVSVSNGSASFTIPIDLKARKAEIYLEKYMSSKLKEKAEAGGVISYNYVTKRKEITIKEDEK